MASGPFIARDRHLMIVITHVYSRRSAGDGLLLDLTLALLERARIPAADCVVMALDAESFRDLPHVRQVPSEPWKKVSLRLFPAAAQLVASGVCLASRGRLHPGELANLVQDAKGVVGVGTGCLRAGTTTEAVGSLVNHFPQLMVAAATDAPTIYLPQSIGPLRGPIGRSLGRLLARIDLVCVRDDTSRQELAPYLTARRLPDLAVMHLAASFDTSLVAEARGGEHAVIAARDIGSRDYVDRLKILAERLNSVSWGVQADPPARKSDRRFYERIGVSSAGNLLDVLGELESGVVVSVRLHGALQAMLSGWPAIHLSYQRKGWGAYADLGLEPYVHDARSFDPVVVAQQVDELRKDPAPFWARIEERRPSLLQASEGLVSEIRRRLTRGED
jgi:polysaccharide pyruvyl transferase WcaK-like protein